jgi:hypothetical protein
MSMFSIFKLLRRPSKGPNQEQGRIKRWEMKICGWLQHRLNKLKREWLYAYFLLILSIYALASVSAIWSSFSKTPVRLNVQSVKIPAHIGRAELKDHLENDNSTDQINHIQLLIQYMDSIKRNHPEAFDSIKKHRPGLIDSLQILKSAITK